MLGAVKFYHYTCTISGSHNSKAKVQSCVDFCCQLITMTLLDSEVPQYFRKSFKPRGTSGAASFRRTQCSLQNAFPHSGEAVQTSGRFRLGIAATQFCDNKKW